jgi:hypothetical protein
MHGGTQVRKSNSAYVGKRNLKSQTGRRCLQLFRIIRMPVTAMAMMKMAPALMGH